MPASHSDPEGARSAAHAPAALLPACCAVSAASWSYGHGSLPAEGASVDEAVPDAAHRLEATRIAGVLLDLLAQPADVHVDGPGVVAEWVSPDALEELIAREHAARLPHQVDEQIE